MAKKKPAAKPAKKLARAKRAEPKPSKPPGIRDRIKCLRRVPAAELLANPKNWRTHGDAQRSALLGLLQEIGYADAAIARELPDGRLELIDGHLRAETTPDQKIPVLVVDLNDAEADKLLATLDPLAGMAGTNNERLNALLREVDTSNAAIQEMLTQVATVAGLYDTSGEPAGDGEQADDEAAAVDLRDTYEVVVECRDEADQQTVYDWLTKEGRQCRVLTF